MKFPYQFAGGPMSWKSGPPRQARAAEATSLGALTLPAPGAPEPINNSGMGDYIAVGDYEGQYVAVAGMGDCGCGCKGAGTCGGKSMGATTDTGTVILRVGSAAAAFYAYKHAKKSKGTSKYVLYAIAAAAAYEAISGS